MIIALAKSNSIVINELKAFRKLYKEKTVIFYMTDAILSYAEEKRLTFIGHANSQTFGEQQFTPKEFAEHLISHDLPKNKEVVIDLIGCSINDFDLITKESYATALARNLYQQGYTNVRVNALNPLASNNSKEFKQTFLYPHTFFPFVKLDTKLTAIKRADFKNYRLARENWNEELASLYYEKTILSTPDIRFTFDNNENFQITSKTVDVDYEYLKLFAALNNHIAKLKEEIHSSTMRKIAEIIPEKKLNKLAILEKLKQDLQNVSPENYPPLIQAALDNKKIATGRTLKALLYTQKRACIVIDLVETALENAQKFTQGTSATSNNLASFYYEAAIKLGHKEAALKLAEIDNANNNSLKNKKS